MNIGMNYANRQNTTWEVDLTLQEIISCDVSLFSNILYMLRKNQVET